MVCGRGTRLRVPSRGIFVKQDIPIEACVAFDLESCLIRPGLCAPPIVCATIADAQGAVFVPTEGVERAIAALLDSDRIIVGHNVAYDFCCILEWLPELRPAVFRAYEADRILDTLLCQRLIEIETGDVRGKLALDLLCARYGLRHETKGATTEDGESVRLSYGRYLGASLEAYPPEFVEYAVDDAKLTLELFRRMLQRGLVGRADLARLCRADLGLKLVAAEGLRCDPERVGLLEQATAARREALQRELLSGGLLRGQKKSMWAIKRAVAEAFELPHEVHQKTPKHQPQVIYTGEEHAELIDRGLLTEKGNISTGRETLEASGDPLLEALAEYGQWSAVWNKDLPAFRFSAEGGVPLHTRFGFAATTRTTSGGGIGGIKFNQQNQRKLPGLRECFVAPDGGAFVATDFTGLENATFAQICLWGMRDRTLVDRYNDPAWDDHSEFGRHIAGRGEDLATFMARLKEPAAKECRAAAKPLRFGLRGGLRKPTTVASYARIGYGVDRPVEFWASMIDLFFATQHSDVAYLTQYVQQFRTENGRYNVPIPGTGIIRRGCGGPAAANTPFQGLGAVVATEALYCTTRDQMLGKMPGRACLFVHDEIGSHTRGSVHPDDVEGLRAAQERAMIESARRIMPDIIMRAESAAMRHWSKKAEHEEDAKGRIVVQDSEYAVKAERKKR